MTVYLPLLFVLLFAAVVLVPFAARLGLGSVLGYLLAGIALAPILDALRVDVAAIQHLAEFGVVVMLFLVGLELRPALLWRMRARLLGLGGAQFVLTAGAVAGLAVVAGLEARAGLAVGLILALSSTAIVLQTLTEKGLLQGDGGQAGFAVLLFQDIAVIPVIALMPFLAAPRMAAEATGADHAEAGPSLIAGLAGWQAALVTLAAVGALILFGRWVATAVLRYVARTRLREMFTAAALMIVLGVALLMSMVGLSPALGTFLAGVILSGSEYRHELEADLNPFRGLLLGVFFMTVGAGIDFGLLAGEFAPILGMTLGLMVLKAAILLGLGRVFGVGGPDRWLFSLGLAQAGEFGFVLLALAVAQGVLPEAVTSRLLIVVALSMLLTPGLFVLHERVLAPRMGRPARPADPIAPGPEIIIAGHGRVGGIVNRMLRGLGHDTTVIDYSADQLEMLRAFGIRVHFGDATRPDLLEAAGIARARLLVIAIDDRDSTTRLVAHVTRAHPHLHVIARAYDRAHTYELWAAGCRDVVRETYDGALRTGRSALEALGMTRDQAEARTRAFEVLDRKSMLSLAQLHRLGEPNHLNPEYTARVREMQEMIARQLRGMGS